MGPQTYGIQTEDISNCTLTANQFKGSGGDAISIYSIEAPVSGCTVTANKGLAEFTTFFDPIYASPGTFDNVLGPHPGATIFDQGCNFNLNDADGGCALAGGALLKDSFSGNTWMSTQPLTPQPQPGRMPGSASLQLRQSLNRR